MSDNKPTRKIKVDWTGSKSGSDVSKSKLSNIIRSRTFLIVVLVVIALLPAAYFYNKSRIAEQRLNDPNTANQKVIDAVVKKVGHLILLPTDEQPTLATITDADKTRSQAFFKNAKNGDKLLVYTQARKAILYRPSTNLIIEVAPLNVSSSGSVNSKQ